MEEPEEIKRRLDIVDFVGGYLTLKRTGQNWRALCPFHQEKTPSFMVNRQRQIYKCFGCGESGDIFDFVMKMENLEFYDALKFLADKAGVTLKREARPEIQRQKGIKSRILEVNDLAARLYHALLKHLIGKRALQYLHDREISDETIRQFQLGYAPAQQVGALFAKKNVYPRELAQAGNPDRFHDRIIFPIRDSFGNVLGFTGRIVPPSEVEPKYFNTPETPVFHKSRILYGLDLAREAIKKESRAVLLEGQMDVILSHQAGVKSAVACSGTALTVDHLRVLSRFTDKIAFAFDSDEAGIKAAKRAVEIALLAETDPQIITIAGFKDVGEVVEKDPKLWREFYAHPVPAIEWLIGEVLKIKNLDEAPKLSSAQKKQAASEIIPFLAIISSPVEQADYVKIFARLLGIEERAVWEALSRVKAKRGAAVSVRAEGIESEPTQPKLPAEKLLLGLLVKYPNKDLFEQVDENEIKTEKEFYKALKTCYNGDEKGILECLKTELPQKQKETDVLLFEIEKDYQDWTASEIGKEIEKLLSRQAISKNEQIKSRFAQEIAEAEKSGDRGRVKKLLQELQQELK